MPGVSDPGALEFEKVSFTDARKALEETGPAAYAVPKKVEDWEAKRSQTAAEPLYGFRVRRADSGIRGDH